MIKNSKIRMNVVIDKNIYKEFQLYSRKDGRSVSEVIRELIIRYIRSSKLKEVISYKPEKLGEIEEIIRKFD